MDNFYISPILVWFINTWKVACFRVEDKEEEVDQRNRWGVGRDGVVDGFRSCTISRLPPFFRLHWPRAWYRLGPCWHRNFVWLIGACAVAPMTTFSLSWTLYYYWKVQQVLNYKLQQSYMHYWEEVQITKRLQSQSYSYRAWLTNN